MAAVTSVLQSTGFPGYTPGMSKKVANIPDAALQQLARVHPAINTFFNLQKIIQKSHRQA